MAVFLNRINERHEIVNLLKQSTKDNTIIILAGFSGVGKSKLVQHVLEYEILEYKSIRVNITKNLANAFDSYHYLNLLYKAVFNYVYKNKDKYTYLSKSIILNPINLLRAFLDWLKNKLGFSEQTRLLEPIYQSDIIRKKEFIEKILSGNNYVIIIENFQTIDASSLEILEEIIMQTTNLVFIFEYTLSNNKEDNLYSIYNCMEKICGKNRVKLLYVNKLNFSEARRLLSNTSNLSEYDINNLEKIYDHSGGNLMHIILTDNSTSMIQAPIESTIEHLSKNSRYLLGILYWLETEFDYYELFKLVSEPYTPNNISFSLIMYENSYKELCKANLVVSDGSILRWRHDSIIAAIENNPIESISYLAYNAVKKYYLDAINKKSLIIECLFSLFVKGGDPDIVDLLPEVRKIVLRQKYPNIIIDKLGFLEQKLFNTSISLRKNSYEMLAEICHAVGLADQAEIYLNKIYDPTNNFHFALKAGILALKYYNPTCKNELDEMAAKPLKPRLRITVGLCRLFGVMMESSKKEGKLYAEQLLADNECVEFVEYGLLLRNYAELIDNIHESIKVYERALKIFKINKYYSYEADIYVALSMLNAYLGKIDLAEKYLQHAVNTDSEIEQSEIYNNKAVISLLKGTYNNETLRNLNNSLLINSYDYDRCIIKCNLLVYYCLVGEKETAKELCIQIENSNHERYNYDEFKHIIYSNLLFYSKIMHDTERKIFYTNKLNELANSRDVCESVVRLIRANLSETDDPEYFYSKFPYRVDFLGNWRFWIDKNIAHI